MDFKQLTEFLENYCNTCHKTKRFSCYMETECCAEEIAKAIIDEFVKGENMVNTNELAYERGFKAGAKLYDEMLKEFKAELQDHAEFAKRAEAEIQKLKNGTQLTVSEFVEHYVAHNSSLYIYKETFEFEQVRDKCKIRKRVDTLLWKGMDWQASGNKEDIAYMQSRGIEPCPYNDYKVIAVRSAVDCKDITAISLVVEENERHTKNQENR